MDGTLAADGRLALSEVARVAGELQAQLERVAQVLVGAEGAKTGRRRSAIVDATRLDLVAFRDGSAVLEVRAHEAHPALFPTLLDDAVESLLDGVGALVDDPLTLPKGYDRGVVQGWRTLTGSLGTAVASIRIDRPSRPAVLIDTRVKEAVQRHLSATSSTAPLVVTGRLHMGDFAPSALRCRIDTVSGSVACDFDADLRDDVLDAMDRLVVARGTVEQGPTSAVGRMHLESVELVDEARSRTLEELAAEQGVQPITSVADLVGPPVDDFDEWLTAVRSVRSS